MRQAKKKVILDACQLSFNGKTDLEIADILGTAVSGVSRWRKSQLWQDFEQELIDAHKRSLLEAQPTTLSEG